MKRGTLVFVAMAMLLVSCGGSQSGGKFAVTHAELDYRQSARFDDVLEVTTWLEWVRGASLAMAYTIVCSSELLVTGRTEHASINGEGRVRRIPKEDRVRMGRAVLRGDGVDGQ